MYNDLIETIKLSDCDGNYITFSTKPSGFMGEDFENIHPGIPVIEILDIYVYPKYRKKGIGSGLLEAVINRFPDTAIIVAAGASIKEYPDEPSDDEMIAITESLRYFYESNGFIDVNKLYGDYEFKCAYMYGNGIGKECIKKRSLEVDEFYKNIDKESD